MDWFPDGSGVVFSDDDAVQSTQKVIHLEMGSGETQVLLEKPFGDNSNPYDVDAFFARAGGSTAVKPMVVSRSAEGVFVYGPAFGLPSSPAGPLPSIAPGSCPRRRSSYSTRARPSPGQPTGAN